MNADAGPFDYRSTGSNARDGHKIPVGLLYHSIDNTPWGSGAQGPVAEHRSPCKRLDAGIPYRFGLTFGSFAARTHSNGMSCRGKERIMELGAFSVSLAVKDIGASKSFYEKLGFSVFGGDASQKWLIMKNGGVVIGLFQGMFERNLLTFNPGWDANARRLKKFTDIRDLQRELKEKGLELAREVEPDGAGPGSFTVVDPDGNTILFDQHV